MLRQYVFSVLAVMFWLVPPGLAHASSDKTDRGDAVKAASGLQSLATPSGPLRILVGHPVVHGLAQQLLRGVDGLELIRVAPARLPANRLPAYLIGRGQDALLAAAAQAHAVLTLRSIWADDQLYQLARRTNIHIIEIDVANPIEGDLPGVTLPGDSAGVLNNPPWQDSANLSRMAALMENTLARLAPGAAPRLRANLVDISQRLQRAEAQTIRALAEAGDLSVLLLSPRMHVLAMTLQLDPVPWQAPETDTDLPDALSRALAQGKPRVVLAHAAPDETLATLIRASGAKLVVLSENADDPVSALTEAMRAIGEAMHGR